MKVVLGSRKYHYMVRASIFLITAVLIWAMTGCTTVYPIEYKLTISSTAGGSVVVPGEGTSTQLKGDRVTLSVKPDDGYRFVRWTGDVGAIGNVNRGSTTIKMEGDYSITAEFEKTPVYHLTVSITGGGQVTIPGKGMFIYNDGKVVKLEAHEDIGWGFVSWTGDVGTIADVDATSTNITMHGNYSITASFEEEEPVTITDTGLEAAIRAARHITNRPLYPSDLKKLTSLDAEAENVSDVTGLEYCISLTKLFLSDNQIDEISSLAGLTSLTYLDLSRNHIGDISPVANLTRLTYLNLSGNQIDDISTVANLTRLTYLDLSGNRISDVSAVGNLLSLGELYLSRNQIDDISALVTLTGLRDLYLSHNRISDVSALASLTRLTELYLSSNRISDVSALTSLASLGDLSLADNQVDDISPLASLSNLTLLNLSNNRISDIQSLVDNPGLSQGDRVYLYNNPLGYSPLIYTSVSTHIAELEARGVIVEY
jgi:Leucine-rich repeat (LRR) protein